MGGKQTKMAPSEYIIVSGAELPLGNFEQETTMTNEELAKLAGSLTFTKAGFPVCNETSTKDEGDKMKIMKLCYKLSTTDTTTLEWKMQMKQRKLDLDDENSRMAAMDFFCVAEDREEVQWIKKQWGSHMSEEETADFDERVATLAKRVREHYDNATIVLDEAVNMKAADMKKVQELMEDDLTNNKEMDEDDRMVLEDQVDEMGASIKSLKDGKCPLRPLIDSILRKLEQKYSTLSVDTPMLRINGTSCLNFSKREDVLAAILPDQNAKVVFMKAPTYTLPRNLCSLMAGFVSFSGEYPVLTKESEEAVQGTPWEGKISLGAPIFSINGKSCKSLKGEAELRELFDEETAKQVIVLATVDGCYTRLVDLPGHHNGGAASRWVHMEQEDFYILHDPETERWLLRDPAEIHYCTQHKPGNYVSKWTWFQCPEAEEAAEEEKAADEEPADGEAAKTEEEDEEDEESDDDGLEMDRWPACAIKTSEHGDMSQKYSTQTVQQVMGIMDDKFARVTRFRASARRSFSGEDIIRLTGVNEKTAAEIMEVKGIDGELSSLEFYKIGLKFNTGE